MSDFFSFEYFDEQPSIAIEGLDDRSSYRRNQSLSQASTEYLREAMRRLVPTTFVYGESGVGNRAYELYGVCYSRAFVGNKSAHLLAALCVMHATYERRCELVILPTDIVYKYADMNTTKIKYSSVLNVYDKMCLELNLPRLEPSMEKIIERIFREGCRLTPESLVFEYTQTAMKIYNEIIKYFPPVPRNMSGRKTNYQNQFRPCTIGVACAVLSGRVHLSKVTKIADMALEMHILPRQIHFVINRYLSKNPDAVENTEDGTKTKRKYRSSFSVAGMEIPPPQTRGHQSKEFRIKRYQELAAMPKDEIYSLVPSHGSPFASQPLAIQSASSSYAKTVPLPLAIQSTSSTYAKTPLAVHSTPSLAKFAPLDVQSTSPLHGKTVPLPLAVRSTQPANDATADPLGFLFTDFSDLLDPVSEDLPVADIDDLDSNSG